MTDAYVNQIEFQTDGGAVESTHDIQDIDHDEFARVDGAYEQMTVGNAEQLISDHKDTNLTPYLFRKTGGGASVGDRKYVKSISGGTVAWNQLAQNGNFADGTIWYAQNGTFSVSNGIATVIPTSTTNTATLVQSKRIDAHVYYGSMSVNVNATSGTTTLQIRDGSAVRTIAKTTTVGAWTTVSGVAKANSANASGYFRVFFPAVSTLDNVSFNARNVMLIDLTQMFGSTIADYIYSLETSTAGAGIAKLRSLGFFTEDYYPYDAGSIKSVGGLVSSESVGFNQMSGILHGYYSQSTGAFVSNSSYVVTEKIKALPNSSYYFSVNGQAESIYLYEWDTEDTYIGRRAINKSVFPFTTSANVGYIAVMSQIGTMFDTTNACINISDTDRNGEYEAYVKRTYLLDSSVTLRGVPKLDSGNELYYDGDVYESDGTVTRRFGIVDLGMLTTWVYYNYGIFYATGLAQAKPSSLNIICGKYIAKEVPLTNPTDKTVWMASSGSNPVLRVCDTAYSDAAAFKTAMSGVYLVYELATPTTEEADPYTELQIIDPNGTEAFNVTPDSDGVAIPVGHTTEYPLDLKGKIESAPNLPSSNGVYVVQYNNGVATYIPLGSDTTIANILQRITALENA